MSIDGIDHIVVLVLENRSFDHVALLARAAALQPRSATRDRRRQLRERTRA
jgi:phospholipase C